jgi:hypothetical protein
LYLPLNSESEYDKHKLIEMAIVQNQQVKLQGKKDAYRVPISSNTLRPSSMEAPATGVTREQEGAWRLQPSSSASEPLATHRCTVRFPIKTPEPNATFHYNLPNLQDIKRQSH